MTAASILLNLGMDPLLNTEGDLHDPLLHFRTLFKSQHLIEAEAIYGYS